MTSARAAGLGALSGAVTAAIVILAGGRIALYAAPGLVFGLIFAAHFRRSQRLPPSRAIAYMLAAGLANAAAVESAQRTALALPAQISGVASMAVAGAVGGVLGGGALAAATQMLLRWRRRSPAVDSLMLALVGGVLGALLLPLIELANGDLMEQASIVVFYVGWQAGYAAGSAHYLWPSTATQS